MHMRSHLLPGKEEKGASAAYLKQFYSTPYLGCNLGHNRIGCRHCCDTMASDNRQVQSICQRSSRSLRINAAETVSRQGMQRRKSA